VWGWSSAEPGPPGKRPERRKQGSVYLYMKKYFITKPKSLPDKFRQAFRFLKIVFLQLKSK